MAGVSSNGSFINDTDDNLSMFAVLEISLSPTARFWILLIFEIPSILCSLLLLCFLCFHRKLRRALHNHVIIALLIAELLSKFIDVPNYLTYLRLGYVWPQTPANCFLWWMVEIGGYNAIGMLMAWASIERHILVFHSQLLNTRKKRILIHYIPLATTIVYPSIFYTIVIFFVPCENMPDYTLNWCVGPCYFELVVLELVDQLMNGMLPTVLVIIFNILLFVRVIKQKQRLCQRVRWHKYRRMIIQLLSCSLLFLLCNLPLQGLLIAQGFKLLPNTVTGPIEPIVYFLSYFIILWMPLVLLGSSPQIWVKIKRMFRAQQLINRVAPQMLQPVPQL